MSQSNWGGPPPGGGWGGNDGGGYGSPPGGGAPPPGGAGAPPGGFAPGGQPPPAGFPPTGFAPPPAGYPPGYTAPGAAGVVAWEDASKGLFARWWETTKGALFNTRPFYAGVAQSDNPWPALTYAVMSGVMAGLSIGITMAVIYLALGQVGGKAMASSGAAGAPSPAAMMSIMGVAAIFIYPVMFAVSSFINPWISGGLQHLTLMIFKGATKPYTASVRVAAYSHAYYLWMMVPFLGYALGWLPAMIFSIIGSIVGLDETHKCGTGKAALAVFLIPVLLGICCCLFYVFIFAAAMSAGRH